jgi:hypothetical protein
MHANALSLVDRFPSKLGGLVFPLRIVGETSAPYSLLSIVCVAIYCVCCYLLRVSSSRFSSRYGMHVVTQDPTTPSDCACTNAPTTVWGNASASSLSDMDDGDAILRWIVCKRACTFPAGMSFKLVHQSNSFRVFQLAVGELRDQLHVGQDPVHVPPHPHRAHKRISRDRCSREVVCRRHRQLVHQSGANAVLQQHRRVPDPAKPPGPPGRQ